jgi:hypothetical protein
MYSTLFFFFFFWCIDIYPILIKLNASDIVQKKKKKKKH